MQFVPTTDSRQGRRLGGGSGIQARQAVLPSAMPFAFQAGSSGFDQFMVGSRNPQQSKQPAVPVRKYQDGQASKWVGAFKITFSLLVAGGINAFLFGVPIWVAAGVSALVSSAQSLIALKIHREDTDFSRKVVSGTRWMMGRKKDYTPSGKEWSMVPVWGVACGLMALVESMVNHAYKKWFSKDGDKPFAEVLKERKDALTNKLRNPSNKPGKLMDWVYKAQLQGMSLSERIMSGVTKTLEVWKSSTGWKKKLGDMVSKVLKQSGKRSMKTAYLLACSAAILGGIFQTSVAAYMQGKIDKRNGFK